MIQSTFNYNFPCGNGYWNQNPNDASSSKWLNGDSSPWSDLAHHLLLLVMMQLGVVDFLAFRRVCKSWRSLAVSNIKEFMASKPPIPMSISNFTSMKGCYCYLEDFEGRKLMTSFHQQQSAGNNCFGLTCGYLILFCGRNRDFWLVNPIKRHQLHFPDFPDLYALQGCNSTTIKGILVFSPSLSQWVFVMLVCGKIYFSIAGKRVWNQIPSDYCMLDLQAFKGKIYILNTQYCLLELRFSPEPKLTRFRFKAYPMFDLLCSELVSSGEKLYIMYHIKIGPFKGRYIVYEVDFGEMKWMICYKTIGEYAFFRSELNHGAVVKPPSSAATMGIYAQDSGRYNIFTTRMWYFPNECFNVDNIMNE